MDGFSGTGSIVERKWSENLEAVLILKIMIQRMVWNGVKCDDFIVATIEIDDIAEAVRHWQ